MPTTTPQNIEELVMNAATAPRVPAQAGKPPKSQYSELEAAQELGISVEALRKLIRSHVVDRDEDVGNIPSTTFQPSDLLVLRLLTSMAPQSE